MTMAEMSGDLPIHPVTGLVAIGLLVDGRPVWPVAGGSGPLGEPPADGGDTDDDQGDADDGAVDGGDGDGDDTTPAAWKPPTEAEWKAEEAKRQRANKEAARRREEVARLRDEVKALKEAPKPTDDKADRKTAAELTQAQERVEAATRREQGALRAAARAALITAGYSGKRDGKMMTSVLGTIDYEALSFDDSGDLLGLDDQIDGIREELPNLFQQPEPETQPKKKTPAKANAGGGRPAPDKPLTWAQQLERQMKGPR